MTVVLSSSKTALEHYRDRYSDVEQESDLTNKDYSAVVKAHDRHYQTMDRLARKLGQNGVSIKKARPKQGDNIFNKATFVISVGGDGTVLSTTRAVDFKVPVLPLRSTPSSNGGLCRYDYNELNTVVDDVINEEYVLQNWTLLKLKYKDHEEVALNDILVGPKKSMNVGRFVVQFHNHTEEHRSSGMVITTGAGSTGWYKNIKKQHLKTGIQWVDNPLSAPYDQMADYLYTFSPERREAWFTNRELLQEQGIQYGQGTLNEDDKLIITSRMNVDGAISIDGDDQERLFSFPRGAQAQIGLADETLSVAHPTQ